jgi:hypothetical protein
MTIETVIAPVFPIKSNTCSASLVGLVTAMVTADRVKACPAARGKLLLARNDCQDIKH